MKINADRIVWGVCMLLIPFVIMFAGPAGAAGYEEVAVLSSTPFVEQQCPQPQAQQPQTGITNTQAGIGGAAAGALVGALTSKKGKTLEGAAIGAVAGGATGVGANMLFGQPQQPQQQQGCTQIQKYNVQYRRNNGETGNMVFTTPPPARFTINFCAPSQGGPERPC